MLDQIDAFFSLVERYKKFRTSSLSSSVQDSVASRFITLFEKHHVKRNQIPRFFGHGLTLADIADDEKLIEKLNHEILQSACNMFAVRLEWLEGSDAKIYETQDFYKRPQDYAEFLSRFAADNEHLTTAYLVLSIDPNWEEDALLVLEEQFAYIGNDPIVRYHLCNGWIHKYWKCRADLTACIAMTLNQNVYVKEKRTMVNIQKHCQGKGFMSDLFALPIALQHKGLFNKSHEEWHPDQWVFDPESYLDGVSDDADGNGKIRALERWLDYFDKGYLETGYHWENPRKEFELKLTSVKKL